MSQQKLTPLATQVRSYLHEHNKITALDAMRAFGLSSGSLTRRLSELRAAGDKIVRVRHKDPITKRAYGEWRLIRKFA